MQTAFKFPKIIAIALLFLLYAGAPILVAAELLENPPKPVVTNVSITANGFVLIEWEMDDIEEVDTWEIKLWSYPDINNPQGGFQTVATIPNDGNLIYLHRNDGACDDRNIYTVLPVKQGQGMLQAEAMQTINLLELVFTGICEREAILEWTAFHPDTDNARYVLFASENGAHPALIADIEASSLTLIGNESTYRNNSPSTTNIYTFKHEGLEPGAAYAYYIEAIHGNGQASRSCVREIETGFYNIPAYFKLLAATVNENNTVDLVYETDISAPISGIEAFRSTVNNPETMDALPLIPPPLAPLATHNDGTASAEETGYYYRMQVNDSCTYPLPDSIMHRTIHLSGEAGTNNTNSIAWNAYEGWEVLEYIIYRKTGNMDDYAEIDRVSSDVRTYTDQMQQSESGSAVYYVEAIAATALIGEQPAYAQSNRIVLARENNPIMPNAFKPKGNTPEFKPVVAFYGPQRPYRFQIYNRWGAMLFESIDPNSGWDGRFNGEYVPMGVYVYVLNYEDVEGNAKTARGTVMVVY